jgi:hypothetical protein
MKAPNLISKELMDSLVLSIVTFMNKAGMSPTEIEHSFRAGLVTLASRQRGGKRTSASPSSEIGCDTIAGAVLRAWHRNPSYLDEIANPIPLCMSGPRKCLASIVKAQDPDADVVKLIGAMQRTGLIKKVGNQQYLPTTSAATISQMHPLAVDHVVKTVLRLVETVTRNMRLVDSQHSLVERYAHIPDLDAKEARAFSDFTRQQGAACLEAIEDWLEARRKGHSRTAAAKRGSLSAGMHVFAYLEQPSTAKLQGLIAKKRKSTSSRAARA